MKVRIGIDVGGTFTDAVAVNNDNYQIIGTCKVPTTHSSPEGVVRGIIQVLKKLVKEYNIAPDDVTFIAHGTTQATNALLEGDVVPVGIIASGSGLEGLKTKSDCQMGDLELAPGKLLTTHTVYVEQDDKSEENIKKAIAELKNKGVGAIVAAKAFSVDEPEGEKTIMEFAEAEGLPATATHEVSKLYGLRIRTRTASINASIMPRMMETAEMTKESVKKSGIRSPLMIMRCDGGVMNVDEMRRRPILTILSGPAAGVAGALMHEKITNGIFFEVGGTSVDISAIKNGRVMINYAEIGGHKTYLNSLDVRTVGIAGGSMFRCDGNKILDVGPRSAHIADLDYCVYAKPDEIIDPEVVFIKPKPSDSEDYVAIKSKNGKVFAVTVSCAANFLGYVKSGDYAFGNFESAKKAFNALAIKMKRPAKEIAREIMDIANSKNQKVVEEFIKDYKLDRDSLIFVGGGGGCSAVVPHLAEKMGLPHRIAKNSEVISPIGVALAMVREVVERTIANPTEDDLISVRREAEEMIMKSGAVKDSVDIFVEVDSKKNIVRAVATGATELRTKDLLHRHLDKKQLREIAAKSMDIEGDLLKKEYDNGYIYAYQGENIEKKFWGIIKIKTHPVRILDDEGVIRISRSDGNLFLTDVGNFESDMSNILDKHIIYGDGGAEVPDCYMAIGPKVIDLSGLMDKKQILSLAKVEFAGKGNSEKVIFAICKRGK